MRFNTKIWTSVNTKSLFVAIVVSLTLVAFIVTGTTSFRGFGGLNDNIAVKIGDTEIDIDEFNNYYRYFSASLTSNATKDEYQMVLNNTFNELIKRNLLTEEARRKNMWANNTEVKNKLLKNKEFYNESGAFDEKKFSDYLKNNSLTEPMLTEKYKKEIANEKYYNIFLLNNFVPSLLLEELNKKNNTEYNIEYAEIKIDEKKLKELISVEAKKYAKNKDNTKNLSNMYKKNKKEFEHPEQIKLSSILISYKNAKLAQGEALKRDDVEAQKIANNILIKLKNNENFATLASQINDDIMAKNAKGDIGWIDESNIDPETIAVAKKLSDNNKVSDLIKTQFGYRIIKYENKRSAIQQSFNDVKEELASRMIDLELRTKQNKFIANSVSQILKDNNISKLNEIFSLNNISWKKIEQPVKLSDKFIKELGMAKNIHTELIKLENASDICKNLINLTDKSIIIKLISKKVPTFLNETDKKTIKNTVEQMENSLFAENTINYLQKLYDKKRLIEKNNRFKNFE